VVIRAGYQGEAVERAALGRFPSVPIARSVAGQRRFWFCKSVRSVLGSMAPVPDDLRYRPRSPSAAGRRGPPPAERPSSGLCGRPYKPDYVTLRFKRLSALAGLPVMKLHEGRHTAASLARDAEVDQTPQASAYAESALVRRRTGIEPASDAARRSLVLKTRGTTRNPDASAHDSTDSSCGLE
jgi:hypothetical protein